MTVLLFHSGILQSSHKLLSHISWKTFLSVPSLYCSTIVKTISDPNAQLVANTSVPLSSDDPGDCIFYSAFVAARSFLHQMRYSVQNWLQSSPSSGSSVSPIWIPYPEDTERKSLICNNIFRFIQIAVSLIGIALSFRLMYYLVEQINPTMKEKREARSRAEKLFRTLGYRKMPTLTDYEICIALSLVETSVLSTSWESIGGLDHMIDDLKDFVITPFERMFEFNVQSKLLKPPKGVLLFGPPGCGKTLLARAMACAARANFINLQVSSLVNMWYGETQKYVEATFSLAHKLQPTIIFVDELDSFLTTRSATDNEATRMIKTQFMALWDGLLTNDNLQILIIGATNRPADLDQAILRRFPYKIHVPLPNAQQRFEILRVLLAGDRLAASLTDQHLRQIASQTDKLSGSDLAELCREAAFFSIRTSSRSDTNVTNLSRPQLQPDHFMQALTKLNSNQLASMNNNMSVEPLD